MTEDVETILKNNLKHYESVLQDHKNGIHLIYTSEDETRNIINDLKDCLNLIEV